MDKIKYFTSKKITDNIIRIAGVTNEFMYLVKGTTKAVLIDTGTGVGDLKEYVQSITDKPITVILTHGHVDHASGAPSFDEVYMNHDDDKVYKEHNKLEARKDYIKSQFKDFDKIQESDYIKEQSSDTYKDLKEGMVFNLGNIHLEIYNASGHTPGQIAILFKEDRILMTGDAANTATFLLDKNSLGITSYEKSMKSLLKKTEGKFDKILLSHGIEEVPKELLSNIVELCTEIKDRKTDDVPFEFMGNKAYIAKKADYKFEREDGRFGNIIYLKEKIEQ